MAGRVFWRIWQDRTIEKVFLSIAEKTAMPSMTNRGEGMVGKPRPMP